MCNHLRLKPKTPDLARGTIRGGVDKGQSLSHKTSIQVEEHDMKTDVAFEVIKKYFAEHFDVDEKLITPDAHLNKDLNLDSIDALDMVALLESNMDIEINIEDFQKVQTVQDVANYLTRNVDNLDDFL